MSKGKRQAKTQEAPVKEPQKKLRGSGAPWWDLGNPCWIGGY